MPAQSLTLKTGLGFVGVALVCVVFADLEISTLHPWQEMRRMVAGLLQPDFFATERLAEAILHTLAFAFLGVAGGAIAGFGFALIFYLRVIRWGCALIRSIHELFWALIFLQVLGLNSVTGILAIAIPYAGIFGKVFAEILEEADQSPLQAIPSGSSHLSSFFYTRLPGVWAHFKSYALYRLECALRSCAVLGFIGLPTVGFHLESAFKQGHYSEVWALLILFYALIASLRLWVRPPLVGFYLLGSPIVVYQEIDLSLDNLRRFFTEDILPYPLRSGTSWLDTEVWAALGNWIWRLFKEQALDGIVATLVLTQIALVGTGMLALVTFPLVSIQFFGPVGRSLGHLWLVIIRSTPEYLLAFILLNFWGPSMLPAIVALALHNGAIIAHLTGRHADGLILRPDRPRGLNLYSYEIVPRLYGQFLAFLFYRWEVIFRETAILGILGIHTLGFYIDSAIQELRLDRAALLILVTAFLNIGIDTLSRFIRRRLHLSTTLHY